MDAYHHARMLGPWRLSGAEMAPVVRSILCSVVPIAMKTVPSTLLTAKANFCCVFWLATVETLPAKKWTAGGYRQNEHAPHVTHAVELAYAHDPAAQVWQVEMDVAATTAEYVPLTHSVQSDEPIVEYDPAQHRVQNELPSPDEYVPAAHDWHWYWPETSAYVPGGQLTHAALEVAARPIEYLPISHVAHGSGPRALL